MIQVILLAHKYDIIYINFNILAPKESSLEEWMFIQQNHNHQQLSDTSSLGIRTPDIGITDMMMTSNSQLFNGGGYTSFLQPSPILQHDPVQLIPSLCVSILMVN